MVVNVLATSYITAALYKRIAKTSNTSMSPLDQATWQLGGLAIGAPQTAGDFIQAVAGSADSGFRDPAVNERLATALANLMNTFIPFYKPAMQIIESATQHEGVDRYAARKFLSSIIKMYRPTWEKYQVQYTPWEMILHAAGLMPSKKAYEQAQKRIEGTPAGSGSRTRATRAGR